MDLVKLVAAIDEISEGVAQMRNLDSTISFDGSVAVQQHRERLSTVLQAIEAVNTTARVTNAAIFTAGMFKYLEDSRGP
jgi:hypothetical protein